METIMRKSDDSYKQASTDRGERREIKEKNLMNESVPCESVVFFLVSHFYPQVAQGLAACVTHLSLSVREHLEMRELLYYRLLSEWLTQAL